MTAAIASAVVTLLLAARLAYINLRLRELAQSAKKREILLIERRATSGAARYIQAIHEELNALIDEKNGTRERERDYFRQVETTLGSIHEAILIIDEDSCVTMANEAARSLMDASATDRQLVGRRVEGLVPSVAFLNYMKSVRLGGKPGNSLVEIVKGGEHLWFEVTGAEISGSASSQKLCLFVLHDITKLKSLENMRTEFVANVSHELRTPVTVIRGFTDTLIEEGDSLPPEDRARFLGKIQRNVARLNNLLEDLLLLSRLEGRGPMLKFETLSLNDILKEVCDNFRDRKSNECTLETALDPSVPPAQVDHLRITQVMDNLLDNANRHARGMTKLVVRTQMKDAEIVCTVEDNGCGIPMTDVPHIFERFYRVDKGRSRELGGTGLGLSIVKHIVMQHGGRVFVESRVGEGTKMGFTIPIRGVHVGSSVF